MFDWHPRWNDNNSGFATRWLSVDQDKRSAAIVASIHSDLAPESSVSALPASIDTDAIWADGFATGQAAAQQDKDAQIAIAHALSELALLPNTAIETLLCRIIFDTVKSVLHMSPITAEEIKNYVAVLLAEIPQNSLRATILLHPDDAAFLISYTLPAHIHLSADTMVRRGTAQLRHDDGLIETGRDGALRAIQERLGGGC